MRPPVRSAGLTASGSAFMRESLVPPGAGSDFVPQYYQREGVRTRSGLLLSPKVAALYGMRYHEYGRGGTTLKGADLGAKLGLFSAAMATSFGWMDEDTAWWMVGGAAALGAIYGGTSGYEKDSWREEWRWPEETAETDEIRIR